jgi:DNA-directed RNA polymerase specialized sigma24 family protein
VTERNAELHDAYAAFGRRVYRYCLFRLGCREDAEDVTADVFVRMMRARHPHGDELLP